jgi:hypothetical protein
MYDLTSGFPLLPQALQQLCTLEESQFELLRQEVTGPQGFVRTLERCQKTADQLRSNLTPRDLFNILTSLQFLYDNSRRWEKADHSGHDALNEFFEFTGLNEALGQSGSICRERLRQLIVVNPEVERRRHRRQLKSGLLDTAIDFVSFVDLRPSFTPDQKSIEELIPVVILRVALKTEYGPDKSCVFQMSADGVLKLRDALKAIENRLDVMRADDAFNSRMEVATVEDEGDNNE